MHDTGLYDNPFLNGRYFVFTPITMIEEWWLGRFGASTVLRYTILIVVYSYLCAGEAQNPWTLIIGGTTTACGQAFPRQTQTTPTPWPKKILACVKQNSL